MKSAEIAAATKIWGFRVSREEKVHLINIFGKVGIHLEKKIENWIPTSKHMPKSIPDESVFLYVQKYKRIRGLAEWFKK
jgi:hypothetical protein